MYVGHCGCNRKEKKKHNSMLVNDTEQDENSKEDNEEEENAPACAVCMADYVEGDVINTLPCGHEFHKDCVAKWLPIKKICPLCRHDITKREKAAPLASNSANNGDRLLANEHNNERPSEEEVLEQT
ncbi:hypothetical protein RFI_23825 [Reticulomyxa filosa]|uniref:RING-type domain-containing protein n=1 Tax=Reticulomyxa filosa TaxID=46433 RepID=X6MHP9_RETFI|nr:hypothetical protein RFI_23825 [Reticulomyxa filosa]|eukprot:ETO13543.1 hypothetical protein RFI_23825 [Reticulomyxa filosa]